MFFFLLGLRHRSGQTIHVVEIEDPAFNFLTKVRICESCPLKTIFTHEVTFLS